MSITVEFLIGTTVEQAIAEAKRKAFYFDVAYVCFDFNGVKFSVSRGAVIADMLTKYDCFTSSTKDSLKVIVG